MHDAYVWEVLGPHLEEFPPFVVDGCERELVCQEAVFVAQPCEIALCHGGLAVACRHGVGLEQSGLSEEEGLHLEDVVSVVVHGVHGEAGGPRLEGVAVDAEAVVACQGGEIAVLPRAVAQLHAPAYGLCLLLQPLRLQGAHPTVHLEAREGGDGLVAGWVVVGGDEFLVVGGHLRGHL